ncbi:MAG: SurA N-terminal domain-containing protein [Candidatus Aminicenantes bacterium]|nr:SurA N-terminal domain-containing protein [Candidatus Aminicenantes bacterium]
MKRIITGLVLAGMLGSAAVFGGGQEVVEEIVAVVNDEIITLSDYRTQFDMTVAQLRAAQLPQADYDKQYVALKKELLNGMITELLLLQKARELNLNVGDQVKAMIEKIKTDNNMTSDVDLRRAVEQQGMSYETWLKQYEEGMMRQAVIYTEVERAIVLDDSEVVQYYKKNPAEFTTPTEYKLHAVYLAAAGRTPEECEALKAAVDAKLKAGAAFADVAGEFSDPPMKESKGDLGTFKAGELDKSLESAVEKLKSGEVGGWVNNKNGWYLLNLVEKKDSFLRPFEDARKEVEEKIYNRKRTEKGDVYIKTLRERSYVRILKPEPLDR